MASNAIALTNAQQRESSRQQHPKIQETSLVDVTVRPKPVNNKQHANHRNQQGRTEQVARAPPSARSPSVPRMRAPLGEAARRCPKPPRGANAPTAAPRNNPRRTTLPRAP